MTYAGTKLSSSPDPRSSNQVGLPAGVEGLLVDVVADGFVLYCCGGRASPTALVAAYGWEGYVDLITMRSFDRITTARIPIPHGGQVDVFTPEVVVWAYEGPPQLALRAMLELVHPAHPDAPITSYPAPPGLHVPRAQQRPMTIQPPSPLRAKARAARLGADAPTPGGQPATNQPMMR